MQDSSLRFLRSLLDSPGPSGFEGGPARIWRDEANGFADSCTRDVNGNSFATIKGSAEAPTIMFAGHIDEIGLMILHIDDDGYLWFETIGGWDEQVFVGQRVVLLTKAGPVRGVIGKKAIHLMEKEDREKPTKAKDLWIDIGAINQAEAATRVRVGDADGFDSIARNSTMFFARRIFGVGGTAVVAFDGYAPHPQVVFVLTTRRGQCIDSGQLDVSGALPMIRLEGKCSRVSGLMIDR